MWNGFRMIPVILPSGLQEWQVNVKWQNLGNVPARFVAKICKELITYTSSLPAFTCVLDQHAYPSGVIGPKQVLSFSGPLIDKKDMADTLSEKAHVYVFGYITYRDNLQDGLEHQTRFCDSITQGGLVDNTATQTQIAPPTPVPRARKRFRVCWMR